MNPELTHERCSELLGPFLARELEPEEHRLVEDHLEHCAQCSAERAALVALEPGDDGLTGAERTALRSGVLEAIADPGSLRLEDESDAVVVPLGHRARAAKYLGIAAMLAILAVGSLFVFRGGELGVSGGDDASTVGQAEDSSDAGGDEEAERVSPEAATEDGSGAGGLRPLFQSDRGALTEADLDGLGRRAARASSPPGPATAQDDGSDETESSTGYLLTEGAAERTLDRLAASAPEALASQIAECGRRARSELEGPALAAHATTATLDGREIVAITFLTGGTPPDRFATFAFARGDCTTILASADGLLE